MKPEIRGLKESLEIVRKVFDNVSIDLNGDVIIIHRGINYGVRTRRFEIIPFEIPIEEITRVISRDIINMTTSEITKPL